MNSILLWRATIMSLICAAFLASGCATIVKGGSQNITVKTHPSGATCDVARKGKSIGVVNPTPGTVQIGKGAAALDVTCKKAGHIDAGATLSSSFQGWTLGNAILGGLVGIAVDAGSGAMHEYPSEISVRLLPESFESSQSRDAYFDRWREDLLSQSEQSKAQIAEKCPKSECEKLLNKAGEVTEAALAEVESNRKRATIATTATAQAATLPPTPRIDANRIVSAPAPAPAPSVEAGQFLRVGDKWKYNFSDRGKAAGSMTVEIMETSDRRVRERFTREGYKGFAAERDVDTVFSSNRFLAPIALPGGYQLAEIAPYLPPGTELKAGQFWDNVPGVFFFPQVGKKTLVSQARVVKQETVRVPAGAFPSWRIETISEDDFSSQGVNVKVKCTFWYSPEMKRTIKMNMDTISSVMAHSGTEDYELVSFDPGK